MACGFLAPRTTPLLIIYFIAIQLSNYILWLVYVQVPRFSGSRFGVAHWAPDSYEDKITEAQSHRPNGFYNGAILLLYLTLWR